MPAADGSDAQPDAQPVAAVSPTSSLGLISGNAFWSLLRYGSSWILLLVVPPYLIHHMANAEYGTWMLLLQFGSYVSLFDSNMQTAIARFVGRAIGQRDRAYLARVLASVLLLLGCGAVLACLLTGAASWQLPRLFPKIPLALVPRAQRGLLIIGASLALALPFTTLVGGFLGLQRNRVITVAVVVAKLLSSAGMIWSVSRGGSIVALSFWFAVSILVPPLFYFFEWLHAREDLPVSLQAASAPVVREIAGFYSLLVVTTLSTIVIIGLDIPIVATYDFHSVGIYGLAVIFGNMLLIPQGAIISAVMPAAAAIGTTGDAAAVGRAMHRFARYASASLCLLTVGLALGAPLFLRVWLGQRLAAQVLPLALALLLAQAVSLTLHPFRIMVLGVGQQARTVPAQLLEALVNVVCSVLLARHIGALGVALGTVISSVVSVGLQFLLSLRLTHRIKVVRWNYFLASTAKPALVCLPAVPLLYLLWRLSWSVPVSGGCTLVGVVATAVLLWGYVFSQEDKAEIVEMVNRKLRRRPAGD